MSSSAAPDSLVDALTSTSLADVEPDEFDEDYEDDMLEDALADSPALKQAHDEMYPQLNPEEHATQAQTFDDDDDDDEAKAAKEKEAKELVELKTTIANEYTTQTAKTRKITSELIIKNELDIIQEEAQPFALINYERDLVNPEDKEAVVLFNALSVTFKKARKDPRFRKFTAQLFKKTDDYYGLRARRADNKKMLSVLYDLRDEQEVENYKKKQAERRKTEEDEARSKRQRF